MGFWDSISKPTEALGEIAGEVTYALTGNDTAKEVASELVARGPAAGAADEVGKAMGLNEAQRGYLELAAGVATLQFGAVGVQGIAYGLHDIVEGRQHGDDLFAMPGGPRPMPRQNHGCDGADNAPPNYHEAQPVPGPCYDPNTVPNSGERPENHADTGYCPPVVTTTTTTTSSAGGTTTTTTTTSTGGATSDPAQAPEGGDDAAINNAINDIFNNPRLSLEEKVAMIMAKLQEKEEGHINKLLKTMSDQETANDQLRADGKKDQVKNDPTLQTELQMAMQRRNELASLTTNVSKAEHETRAAIIGNIR